MTARAVAYLLLAALAFDREAVLRLLQLRVVLAAELVAEERHQARTRTRRAAKLTGLVQHLVNVLHNIYTRLRKIGTHWGKSLEHLL